MAATQCKAHLNVFRMKGALYKSGIIIIVYTRVVPKVRDKLNTLNISGVSAKRPVNFITITIVLCFRDIKR